MRAECEIRKSRSISEAGAHRHLKLEVVGHVENAPPACNRRNSDRSLQPIRSVRIASFIRALRRCAREWLQQLQEHMRAEILRVGLPCDPDTPFMHDYFSENVFDYAFVELRNKEEQTSAWPTDDGISLLDACVTIFGSDDLLLEKKENMNQKRGEEMAAAYAQRPGSLYVGNFCAQEKYLAHRERAGSEPPDDHVHIALKLRSGVSGVLGGRRKRQAFLEFLHSMPMETARHVAQVPFRQPDLAAVVAEYPNAVNC